MIRVLVAEDSRTVRELLVGMLESDPEIRVVGEAKNGLEAVELAVRLRPDVITMDIFMPLMDGLEATTEIMTRAPTRIIIISSATRQRDVQLALDATRAGAVMVAGRPDLPLDDTYERERAELVSMIKAMAHVKVVRRWGRGRARGPVPPPTSCIELVAMAASTGGPDAIRRILAALPASFPAPILLVQHIAPGFVTGFADWLGKASNLRVTLAADRAHVERGSVYVAPDDRHLGLWDDRSVRLSTEAPIHGLRPSATYLFRSAARAQPRMAAVILTGMGQDGVEGLLAVKAVGGLVVAQDEASSVVYGMPGEARAAGVVDAVLPLDAIPRQLSRWCAGVNDESKDPDR